jgi:hypothetical protein
MAHDGVVLATILIQVEPLAGQVASFSTWPACGA